MNKKGFTLLEIVVSMAIFSMIGLTIGLFSGGSIDAEERRNTRDAVYQMARFAVERVVADVNTAYLVTNSALLGKTKDGAVVQTAFIGKDEGDFAKLDFNSLSHWRVFRNSKESDQAEVGYYTEKDTESDDLYRLMRRENPYMDNKVEEGGSASPIAEGINGFQLEFYDGRKYEWQNEWDSTQTENRNALPRAVKISISFPDPNDEEEKITFTTIALIQLWQYPIEF